MIDPRTKVMINSIAKLYLPVLKTSMQKELDSFPAKDRAKGESILLTMSQMSTDNLADYVKRNFKYRSEKVDHIYAPEITAVKGEGDCDDSAWLLNRVRPVGKIYHISKIVQGKVQSFDKWHYIYVEGGNIWSNFKLEAKELSGNDVFAWVKKNYKWANLLTEIKADFSGIGVVKEL